jgi:EAL domain-containing protein (putative c-di-GMP-specific phosphodiesterase class I)
VNQKPATAKRELDRNLFPGADGSVFAVYEDYVLRSAFQPIFDRRRQLCAYEALLRPSTLSGAPTSPDQIFHTQPRGDAERARQIMLDKLASLVHLRNYARYRLLFPVHINVLPATLIDGFASFPGRSPIDGRLAAIGIAPQNVVFEVTEDSHADEARLAAAIIEMRRSGYQFGVDDYGDGNASTARARLLSPNVIKLDRRLVGKYMRGDTREVLSAIELARGIQAKTVAEGIEAPLQFEVLSRAGLDMFQGNYLGAAAPLSDLYELPGRVGRPTRTTVAAEMLII